ncbi:hypothetical protein DY120_07330 [Apilactobacillus micheneri]|uniref:Phage transcriptional regulator, ArpU family n=1 Tax=Apilactobacillus micheneri TaxID=1899430 RepID=A0ABY2YVU8_9LACO|nr:hypothetical protein [Apilactobacillus micheneri]TPR23110.1 hypothetical protein DY114_07315 [Apilactobacillus micheneri]TPR24428.1 hypothetical protein DY111_07330 [Apilactobacillus micheneri]TPR29375.1 hypothetical protein DY120_07330 [Apilactobacillus micheneri]TPR34582.1 hypothetical protein DY027_07320 [Apilactobacillus micheneri]
MSRKKTTKSIKAENIFIKYRKKRELEVRNNLSALKSPSTDGMPKPPTMQNNSDEKIISEMSAQQFCILVRSTVESIDNNLYKFILRSRFLNGCRCHDIAMHLKMSDSAYYDKQIESLEKFYNLCPLIEHVETQNN